MVTEANTILPAGSDQSNNLVSDLSTYFGYPCTIEICSWDKGITWTGIDETEIKKIDDLSEFGLPLVTLCNLEESSNWLASFPEGVQEQLIDYEMKYHGSLYVLLWFISRSQYALQLFQTSPLLAWLIIRTAQSKCWDIEFVFDLFSSKRTKILAECGLDESTALLNILQKLNFKHFKRREFAMIVEYNWKNVIKHLSHLSSIDGRLLKFLDQFPELKTSKLIQKYIPDSNWRDFEMTFKDTLRVGDELAIGDIFTRIKNCRGISQLTSLHDRLVAELNDKALQDIPLIEYDKPLIEGTDAIVPITNNRELFFEGKAQHHCIYIYHDRIVRGDYYAYQILEPERATLGLHKTVAGGYVIDQIHLKYNGAVSAETRESIKLWLDKGAGRVV